MTALEYKAIDIVVACELLRGEIPKEWEKIYAKELKELPPERIKKIKELKAELKKKNKKAVVKIVLELVKGVETIQKERKADIDILRAVIQRKFLDIMRKYGVREGITIQLINAYLEDILNKQSL